MADTGNALAALFSTLEDDVKKQVNDIATKQISDLEQMIEKYGRLEVSVNGTRNIITGLKHVQLPQLITYAAHRLPTLLVGMAGTGKTHAAEQVSESLGLPFYAISVGAQTSKSDIMGYMHANGGYVKSMFREAYENGGVFLMDEIDAGNANVLIQVNSALSNKYCAFPDGMVKRHENFVFIASANTFGNGANRMYVGRNQLDAATLDRFIVMEWMVDNELENALAGEDETGKRWYEAVIAVRKYIESNGLRALVTPRATLRGATLLASGVDFDEVLEVALLAPLPSDKKSVFKDVAVRAYRDAKPKTRTTKAKAIGSKLEVSKSGVVRQRGAVDDIERRIMEGDLI